VLPTIGTLATFNTLHSSKGRASLKSVVTLGLSPWYGACVGSLLVSGAQKMGNADAVDRCTALGHLLATPDPMEEAP